MAQNTQSATASRNTVPGTANEKPVAPALFTTTKREYIPDAKRATELLQTKEMEQARVLFDEGDYGAARREAKRVLKTKDVSPEARLVRVKRLRLADNEPMAMEVLHIPEALVPGLSKADLEDHSFYELLEERYGIVIVSGTQSIEPTVTSEEESEVLGVPLHMPAFLFERTTASESGRVVEFVRSIYRGDRYRLVADLTLPRTRNGRSRGARDHNGERRAEFSRRGKQPT